MCKFKPLNKHILVKKRIKPPTTNSAVLIPEDAQLEDDERYAVVKFICASTDCDKFLSSLNIEQPTWASQIGTMDDVFTTAVKENGTASLVVEKRMIEHIVIENKTFHLVHQNYVVGVIGD